MINDQSSIEDSEKLSLYELSSDGDRLKFSKSVPPEQISTELCIDEIKENVGYSYELCGCNVLE